MLGLPALSFKVLSFPTRNFKCMQFIPQWNLSYTSETAVSGRWVISHVVGHVTPLLYSTLLQECSAFSWGNGLRRQVCEVTYSDNTKPGAAWRANHSSGRNFLVKFFFFALYFTYRQWRTGYHPSHVIRSVKITSRYEVWSSCGTGCYAVMILRDVLRTDVSTQPAAGTFRPSKTLVCANQVTLSHPKIPPS